MSLTLAFNAASVNVSVFVMDSAGDPATGVAFGDVSTEWRHEDDTAWASIALVAGTLGVYASGAWVEIGNGAYQLGLPAAAINPGKQSMLRITYDGVTSVPASLCFTGVPEKSYHSLAGPLRVYGSLRAGEFLMLAKTERVNVAGAGDSNQVKDGDGHDHGFQKWLFKMFGLFATGMTSVADNNFLGGLVGYGWSTVNAGGGKDDWTNVGADAFFHDRMNFEDTNSEILDYCWLPLGGSSNGENGIILSPSVFDITEAWKYAYLHGEFASDAGSIRDQIRRADPPNSSVVHAAAFVPAAGADGLVWREINAPADPARSTWAGLAGRHTGGGDTQTGKAFTAYQRMIRADATTGASYSTMHGVGGQSLRDMAGDFQGFSDNTLKTYFEALMQHGDGKCVFTISSGVNDRGESLASVGPLAEADGDGPIAFADNFEALRSRLLTGWELAGKDPNDLAILFFVTHPISEPRDAELDAYRKVAIQQIAQLPGVMVVDVASGYTAADMLDYYLVPGGDQNHLNQLGYEVVDGAVMDAAVRDVVSSSAPTTTQIRTELAPELAMLDATVSSRATDQDVLTPQDVIDAVDNSQTSGDLNAVTTTLGTPAGASIADDIAAVSSAGGGGDATAENQDALDSKIDTLLSRTSGEFSVTVVSPVGPTGQTLELVKGDDYTGGNDGREIVIDTPLSTIGFAAAGVASATMTIRDRQSDSVVATSIGAAADTTGNAGADVLRTTFSLTTTDTAGLPVGRRTCLFDVLATLADGSRVSLVAEGEVNVANWMTRTP